MANEYQFQLYHQCLTVLQEYFPNVITDLNISNDANALDYENVRALLDRVELKLNAILFVEGDEKTTLNHIALLLHLLSLSFYTNRLDAIESRIQTLKSQFSTDEKDDAPTPVPARLTKEALHDDDDSASDRDDAENRTDPHVQRAKSLRIALKGFKTLLEGIQVEKSRQSRLSSGSDSPVSAVAADEANSHHQKKLREALVKLEELSVELAIIAATKSTKGRSIGVTESYHQSVAAGGFGFSGPKDAPQQTTLENTNLNRLFVHFLGDQQSSFARYSFNSLTADTISFTDHFATGDANFSQQLTIHTDRSENLIGRSILNMWLHYIVTTIPFSLTASSGASIKSISVNLHNNEDGLVFRRLPMALNYTSVQLLLLACAGDDDIKTLMEELSFQSGDKKDPSLIAALLDPSSALNQKYEITSIGPKQVYARTKQGPLRFLTLQAEEAIISKWIDDNHDVLKYTAKTGGTATIQYHDLITFDMTQDAVNGYENVLTPLQNASCCPKLFSCRRSGHYRPPAVTALRFLWDTCSAAFLPADCRQFLRQPDDDEKQRLDYYRLRKESDEASLSRGSRNLAGEFTEDELLSDAATGDRQSLKLRKKLAKRAAKKYSTVGPGTLQELQKLNPRSSSDKTEEDDDQQQYESSSASNYPARPPGGSVRFTTSDT